MYDAPKDTHKKTRFDKNNVLCANVHLFSDVLQANENNAADAPLLLLNLVKEGYYGGVKYDSFRSFYTTLGW